MREWLQNLPCVTNGSVRIDVRGPYPVAIIGIKALAIECKEDFFMFIALNL